MEFTEDSDEDTIMVVEEEVCSENSSSEEQFPSLVTHGKMTIRAASNLNENLYEKMRLTKSLEHPALRSERLGRRNTYKNLNLCKNKQDEYDKIIRSASEFLSGIFPNSTAFSKTSEHAFDNKYTMKLTQDDDVYDKKDNFTFGTFSRSNTKIAEHKSTCEKEKTQQRTKRENCNSLDYHKEIKGQKKENLYTIEEAVDFKSSDDENINEGHKVNIEYREKRNLAKNPKLNINEDESEKDHVRQCSKISNRKENKMLLNNPEANIILHNSPKSYHVTADEKSEATQNLEEKIILVNHESGLDNDKNMNSELYEGVSKSSNVEERVEDFGIFDMKLLYDIIELEYMDIMKNIEEIENRSNYSFPSIIYQDRGETFIIDEYENEIHMILLHEALPKFENVEERIEDFGIFDMKLLYDIIELEYMDIMKNIEEIENSSNLNFPSMTYQDWSETCIIDEYKNEIHMILLHEVPPGFDNVEERIEYLENIDNTDHYIDMRLIHENVEMEYMEIMKENSFYETILYNTASTVCSKDNSILINGLPQHNENIKVQVEDQFRVSENSKSVIGMIEDDYHGVLQTIMDTDITIYEFLSCRYKESKETKDSTKSYKVLNKHDTRDCLALVSPLDTSASSLTTQKFQELKGDTENENNPSAFSQITIEQLIACSDDTMNNEKSMRSDAKKDMKNVTIEYDISRQNTQKTVSKESEKCIDMTKETTVFTINMLDENTPKNDENNFERTANTGTLNIPSISISTQTSVENVKKDSLEDDDGCSSIPIEQIQQENEMSDVFASKSDLVDLFNIVIDKDLNPETKKDKIEKSTITKNIHNEQQNKEITNTCEDQPIFLSKQLGFPSLFHDEQYMNIPIEEKVIGQTSERILFKRKELQALETIIVDESQEENESIYSSEDNQSLANNDKEQIDSAVDSLNILDRNNKTPELQKSELRDICTEEISENKDSTNKNSNTGKSINHFESINTKEEIGNIKTNISPINSIDTTKIINSTNKTVSAEPILKTDKIMEKTGNIDACKGDEKIIESTETDNNTSKIEECVHENKTQHYNNETKSLEFNKETNSSKESYRSALNLKDENSYENILDTDVNRNVQVDIIKPKETSIDHRIVTRKIKSEKYDIKDDIQDAKFDMKNELLNIQDKLAGNEYEHLDICPEEANMESSEANFLSLKRLQSLETFPSITLNDTKEESKNISKNENNQPMLLLKKDAEQTNTSCTRKHEETRNKSIEILEIKKLVPQCEQRNTLTEETCINDDSMNIESMLGTQINKSKLINTKEEVSASKIYLSERIKLTESIDSRMETDGSEPVFETSKMKDINISTNETNNDKFNTEMEKCILHGETIKCYTENQPTIPNKKPKEEKIGDQSFGKECLVPSATEVKTEDILIKDLASNEQEEIMRPSVIEMKYSKNVTHDIDMEKFKTNEDNNLLSEVDMESNPYSPKAPVLESGYPDTEQDSENARQNLLSKIQDNIQVIDLYERRIKCIAQTIIEHESECEKNIKYFHQSNVQKERNKEKLQSKSSRRQVDNIWFLERIGKDLILFLLLLLLGLVLLYLTLDPSSLPFHGDDDVPAVLPHECHGDVPPQLSHHCDLPSPANSCTLGGYRLLASGGLSLM